ncbi:hypothetical protein GCM10027268_18290 [Brachybacterium huguangmaarense]
MAIYGPFIVVDGWRASSGGPGSAVAAEAVGTVVNAECVGIIAPGHSPCKAMPGWGLT